MNVLLNLSSRLFSEALYHLLKNENEYTVIVANDMMYSVNNFLPNIILVDFNTINSGLFSKYPGSKVILIDTGIRQEDIIAILISYKISGILSTQMDSHLFRKALKVIYEGEVWIDNTTIKAFLKNTGLLSKNGKINGLTDKEKEIIEYVCKGYRNKQIASKLSISTHTVKAHLNKIFKKFNITCRSQLISIAINNRNGNFNGLKI